jgi:hypothetical protein
MPDMQAIHMWTSVAREFRGNNSVIFDLFNEPYPEVASEDNETEGWQCWLRGGVCQGIGYLVAGMQVLVNAVRSAGANNAIMLGGLAWANDLTQWMSYEPSDPDHNLLASWHSYGFNSCNSRPCWMSQVAPVISRVPVIAGEIGDNDCTSAYISRLMPWLDRHRTGYLAWAWDVEHKACPGGSGLISSYQGIPTPYGAGFESHLDRLAEGHTTGS